MKVSDKCSDRVIVFYLQLSLLLIYWFQFIITDLIKTDFACKQLVMPRGLWITQLHLLSIISCSESELRARTDYTQYATVYGITDISLSGSDVIQTGSQLRDPDTEEFGWTFCWRSSKSRSDKLYFMPTDFYTFKPQHPQISSIYFFTYSIKMIFSSGYKSLWNSFEIWVTQPITGLQRRHVITAPHQLHAHFSCLKLTVLHCNIKKL